MNKYFYIIFFLISITFSCIKKSDSLSKDIHSESTLWEIEDINGGCFLTNYKGNQENIIIPKTVDNKKVIGMKGKISENPNEEDVSIFGNIQKSSRIKTVDFSFAEHLKVIGVFSFLKCQNIKKITLPESIEIIEDASFMLCKSLDTVIMTNNIHRLGIEIFWECTSLKYINIPTKITNIPKSVFYKCSSLNNIIIPKNVENIGNFCFSDCTMLYNITIQRNSTPLVSFGDNIFNNTPLSKNRGTVYIPIGTNYQDILKNKISDSNIFIELNI